MEAKRSKTGNKRYPREVKRRCIDYKIDKNLSYKKLQTWIKKEYGETVNLSTLRIWKLWHKNEKLGVTGGSSAEVLNAKNPNWNQHELRELKLGVELGLTDSQIAQCMEEDLELNYRKYTAGSISNVKSRHGLTKNTKHLALAKSEAKQLAKDLTEEMGMTLLEYKNAHRVLVKCNKCDYQWVRSLNTIKRKIGCPTCILPPSSYHEIYVIVFYNFGNPSVKVGITVDYYNKRRKDFPEHKVIEVYPTTFKEAVEIENLIKEKYGIYRTTPPELHNNGATECYDISQTEIINKAIKEQLYG